MQNREFPCDQCSTINILGNYYCISCGKKFSYNCPDCHSEVTPEFKYCKTCGAELLWNDYNASQEKPAIKEEKIEIVREEPGKGGSQKQTKKYIMSPVPWIIVFIVLVIAIALMFNFDKFIN